MKTIRISITTQIDPKPHGFCVDDNLKKRTYEVSLEDGLIELADLAYEKTEKINDEIIQDWFTRNPGKDECDFRGDEFIGCTWVEKQLMDHEPFYELDSATELKEELQKIIDSN